MATEEPSHRGQPESRAAKDKLKELEAAFKRDPGKAVLAYTITTELCKCCQTRSIVPAYELGGEEHTHSKAFAVHIDLPPHLLGQDTAPTPGEHLLAALGSCLCMSFARLTECRHLSAAPTSCVVRGEVDLRGCFAIEDVPVAFTRIATTFLVPHDSPLDELEAVAHEAVQHSVIARSLSADIDMTVRVEAQADKGKEERMDTIPGSEERRQQLEQEQRRAGLDASESEKPQ